MSDSLYSGLCEVLGPQNVIEFPDKRSYHCGRSAASHSTTYAYPLYSVYSLERLIDMANQGEFDAVLVASMREDASPLVTRFFSGLRRRLPVAYIDGEDHEGLIWEALEESLRPHRADVYFKREYAPWMAADPRVVPLQFGCVTNTMPQIVPGREADFDVCWIGTISSAVRQRVVNVLQELTHLRVLVDCTGQLGFSDYCDLLNRSRIAVSARGAGFDTMRYWEIPYCGSMLLTEQPTIIIPNDFRQGVSADYFAGDAGDLRDKVEYHLSMEASRAAMAAEGRRHLLRFHTTAARADYLLKLLFAAHVSSEVPYEAVGLAGSLLQRFWLPDTRLTFEPGELRAGDSEGGRLRQGGGEVGARDPAAIRAEEGRFLSQAVMPHGQRGIAVGCGDRKLLLGCLAIDNRPTRAADMVVADLGRLPLEDGLLDYVISDHSLERCANPVGALREWRQKLRMGGVLALVCRDHAVAIPPVHSAPYTQVTTESICLEWAKLAGGLLPVSRQPLASGADFGIVFRCIPEILQVERQARLRAFAAQYALPTERPSVLAKEQGWFADENRDVLRELLADGAGVVVELGSWLGVSTRFLADMVPNGVVFAVDHWEGSVEHHTHPHLRHWLPTLYETFLVNCWEYGPRIVPVRETSVTGMRLLHANGVTPDLIYIDASHEYADVRADLETALTLFPVTPLVGDDWGWDTVSSAVQDAVAALVPRRQLAYQGPCWWLLAP
jgi:SAM-dependent methyltransferase